MSVETRKELRQNKIRERVSSIQTKNAQQKLDLLKKIDSNSLSERDVKVKNALIDRQKDIIKGLKPPTLASSAAKFGLKSLPAIGTFLSIFSSKPAYKAGGKVTKKQR